MLKIHLIAAARPNFMKIAPLYHALTGTDWCEPIIVHTGQHYDANMSDAFFRDLRMPTPHVHLGVGSGSHAEQTGSVMIAYEKIASQEMPDWIIVVGDVNSTVACAMVGTKMWIPVVHLEAGLRSGDRSMPEEINRLATDAISDVLWTPSPDANENLSAEGIGAERVDFVGNIMIDSYELMRESIAADGTRRSLGLERSDYCVVTLHRPSNVDRRENLALLIDQLKIVAQHIQIVFVAHPRTRRRMAEFDVLARIAQSPGIRMTEPLGYLQFMNLVSGARACITDSGGVQEETTYLGIPCLTLRKNTERPITVSIGTNCLVGPGDMMAKIDMILRGNWPVGQIPELWDGRAASRCVEALARRANIVQF